LADLGIDAANDETDKLELETTMQYIKDILKVKLDDAGLFVIQELVQAPSIGEITRKGYVEGWKKAGSVFMNSRVGTAA
jgi:DCN1-like protein 1/2